MKLPRSPPPEETSNRPQAPPLNTGTGSVPPTSSHLPSPTSLSFQLFAAYRKAPGVTDDTTLYNYAGVPIDFHNGSFSQPFTVEITGTPISKKFTNLPSLIAYKNDVLDLQAGATAKISAFDIIVWYAPNPPTPQAGYTLL